MLAPLPTEQKTYLPQRLKMSYEEYLNWPSDSQKIEWSNGEAIIYMPASDRHQDMIGFLYSLLRTFVELFGLGFVRQAPFEVKLWPDGPSREPDLFFLSHNNPAQVTSTLITGAPDLVVELISRGSVTIDRVDKFREYEQAGVKEYWLIEARPRRHNAEFFVLDPEIGYVPAEPDENNLYRSTVLPHFWLNTDWLLQQPFVELALAEIMLTIDDLPATDKAFYQNAYQFYAQKSNPS